MSILALRAFATQLKMVPKQSTNLHISSQPRNQFQKSIHLKLLFYQLEYVYPYLLA